MKWLYKKINQAHGKTVFLVSLVLSSTLLLSSCLSYNSSETKYSTASPVIFPPSGDKDTATYYLDSEASQVSIKVYRTGRLAKLGHNHVLVIKNLQGVIYLPPDPLSARVQLVFSVGDMELDNPTRRLAAGSDFNKDISERDIQATRNNMLGEKMLQAEQYPQISIMLNKISGVWPEQTLYCQIVLRGQAYQLVIPASIQIEPEQILASGQFSVKQSALGLTPISLFGGALAVADTLKVEFSLVAKRAK